MRCPDCDAVVLNKVTEAAGMAQGSLPQFQVRTG